MNVHVHAAYPWGVGQLGKLEPIISQFVDLIIGVAPLALCHRMRDSIDLKSMS